MDLLKPRNYIRRFWIELPLLNVVVGQRTIERILTRYERDWDVIMPGCRLGVIHPAKVLQPILIPNALVLWRRFAANLLFTDPKNCCNNVRPPGKNIC